MPKTKITMPPFKYSDFLPPRMFHKLNKKELNQKKKKKYNKGPVIKEWVDLTLCDFVDDILNGLQAGYNPKDLMPVIDSYSNQIFDAFNK